jgi:hypothetical protein
MACLPRFDESVTRFEDGKSSEKQREPSMMIIRYVDATSFAIVIICEESVFVSRLPPLRQ